MTLEAIAALRFAALVAFFPDDPSLTEARNETTPASMDDRPNSELARTVADEDQQPTVSGLWRKQLSGFGFAVSGASGLLILFAQGHVVGIVTYVVVTLLALAVRTLANPQRVSSWLYEMATIPPAITNLIEVAKRERRKWSR